MIYTFKPSYLRSLKNLDKKRKLSVDKAIESLIKFFQTREIPKDLGLKQLRYNLWEIRADLSDRVIFRRISNRVEFIIVGSHDEIKRFLRNV